MHKLTKICLENEFQRAKISLSYVNSALTLQTGNRKMNIDL